MWGLMKLRSIVFASVCLTLAGFAHAADRTVMLPIKDVLESAEFQEKVGSDVKFYFGNQKAPVVKKLTRDVVTNKKTNAFAKSDESACRTAMLSALIQLKERAQADGGNAAVNIISFYKKNPYSSTDQYECHAGGVIAGVALKADIAKVR